MKCFKGTEARQELFFSFALCCTLSSVLAHSRTNRLKRVSTQ